MQSQVESPLDVEQVLQRPLLARRFPAGLRPASRARSSATRHCRGSRGWAARHPVSGSTKPCISGSCRTSSSSPPTTALKLLERLARGRLPRRQRVAGHGSLELPSASSLPRSPPERLVLDIAENATVDNYHLFTEVIDHLRSLGVRIALDDAGAADVGLQHLLGVRPDIVKIDTTVIHGIAEDELRQAVACAYASLAKRAGAISLAEGIETEAELAMLLSLEVETGQGYLLGRPAFLEDLTARGRSALPRAARGDQNLKVTPVSSSDTSQSRRAVSSSLPRRRLHFGRKPRSSPKPSGP